MRMSATAATSCARAQHLPLLSIFLLLTIFQSSLLTVLAAEWEFSYDESSPLGPQHWGDLHAEWSTCRDGREQSPVDINNINCVQPRPQCLDVHYYGNPAVVQNKGHDIMVNWTHGAGCFKIDGETYVLRQSHWHSPAEHTIYGMRT